MEKISLADVSTVDGKVSLAQLTGLKIADILGYIANEYDVPVFKLSEIIFENGLSIWVEGEHDYPYASADGWNLDEETLADLYQQQ